MACFVCVLDDEFVRHFLHAHTCIEEYALRAMTLSHVTCPIQTKTDHEFVRHFVVCCIHFLNLEIIQVGHELGLASDSSLAMAGGNR